MNEAGPEGRQMRVSFRLQHCLMCLWLLVAFAAAAADPNWDQLFNAAAKAYQDGFYERAEKEFGELAQKFPNAERTPEAILFQAQSRFQLKRFPAVLELLQSRLPASGPFADQYHHLMAQAHLQRGDFASAASTHAQLLKDYPGSPLRLDAALGEAFARFRAGEFKRTIELLRDPAGAFQKTAQGHTNALLVARGYLLLGEAFFSEKDFSAAAQAVQPLAANALTPELEWERQFLLTRIELADQKVDAALQRATNLVALAHSSNQPPLRARSLRLQAEILERTRPDSAVQAYDQITQIDGVTPEDRRHALLRIVELSARQNQFTNAITRLDAFIGQNAQDPKMDSLRLTLGELHLKNYYALRGPLSATNAENRRMILTNVLQQARAQADLVIAGFTNSPLVGKAYLNRGWTLWEEHQQTSDPARLGEGLAAFQTAAERLPRSEDQAVARFKWADCQFVQKDFAGAIRNYRQLLDQYADLPAVKQGYFEQALHQIVRAALEIKDLAEAQSAVARMLEDFPKGPLADRTLLLYAQALTQLRQPDKALEVLQDFSRRFADSELMPRARLAMAQAHVQKTNWPAAVKEYETWLSTHTNHPARPQVEFDRAWAFFQSGAETNALHSFTNFVSLYPTNSLAPLAQYWVADYFFRQRDFLNAELHYQNRIFSSTNAPPSDLGFQASLMASRSAFFREGYADARRYLTNLINHPECPAPLRPEAYLLLADVFIQEPSPDSTNRFRNFEEALNPLTRLINQFPTNRLAVLAWGRIGDCSLQLAAQDPARAPKRYEESTNAYHKVIEFGSLASVAARSQAEVGLGRVLEKLAELKSVPERNALLDQSLNHYLNVVFARRINADAGEFPDTFWVKEAGLAAGKLAEALQKKNEAAQLYRRLLIEVPALRQVWEKKLEQLSAPPPTASKQ
jgi:outer membrane protein assembly factor BamD (BamD/ComL family)